MAIAGIDLGATKISGALFRDDGTIINRTTELLDGRTGRGVAELLTGIADALASETDGLAGIGICVPGIADHRTGLVWAPNIPGWESYPLRKEVYDHFGGGTAVCIESDRTCYILGEIWKGAASGCGNAIYISVGTGIGAGIFSDGRIIHGSADIAGATGWMALEPPYREEFAGIGCFEYYASGRGICENAGRELRTGKWKHSLLAHAGKPGLTTKDVFEAFEAGDPLAVKVINKAVEMWGMAAANFVSLFDPEIVIFGGGVFGPAVSLISRIHEEALKWGQPVSMKKVRFTASALGGEAGVYGAARSIMIKEPAER